jgi:hypothetical protein
VYDAADAKLIRDRSWRMKTDPNGCRKKETPGPKAAASSCWKEHVAHDSKSIMKRQKQQAYEEREGANILQHGSKAQHPLCALRKTEVGRSK